MKEGDRCKINGKTEEYRSLGNKVSTLIIKARNLPNKIEDGKKRSKNNLETFSDSLGQVTNMVHPVEILVLKQMLSW